MKYITVILFLITTITGGIRYNSDKQIYDYIYELISSTRTGLTERKTRMVIKYAKKYGINEIIFSKIPLIESSYDHTKRHERTKCYGLGGVSSVYWSHLLYRIDNGKLGKYILENNITDTDKYFFRIGYNLEMSAIIFSDAIKRYGNYKDAIIFYSGYAGKYGKLYPEKKKKYVSRVLDF